jgi:UPF0716 protein FxsA
VVLLAGRRAATVAAGAEAFARASRRGGGEVIEGEVVDEVFEGVVIDEEPRTPTRDPRVLP